MKNKGKIIAMDISEKKLEQLRERSPVTARPA